MCGIGFVLGGFPVDESTVDSCLKTLGRRGPDSASTRTIELKNGGVLLLLAAVLHLRGERTFPQPSEDGNGNILLWNGEVFGGLEVHQSKSDTREVLRLLSTTGSDEEVVLALGGISGPFSFVYWCSGRQTLYYGRDSVGRRSLVVRHARGVGESLAVFSCIPDGTDLFQQNASANEKTSVSSSQQPPNNPTSGVRRCGSGRFSQGGEFYGEIAKAGEEKTIESETEYRESSSTAATGEGDAWDEVRADGVYRIQLTAEELPTQETGTGNWFVPPARLHPWAAINSDAGATSGAVDEKPTVTSAQHTCHDIEKEWEVTNSLTDGHTAEASPVYLGLLSRLRESIHRRVSTIPFHSSHAFKSEIFSMETASFHSLPSESINGVEASSSVTVGNGELGVLSNIPARVGVLFSGGLDSVVIAAMLAEEGAGPAAVPRGEAIDLINVCFDRPSKHASPDRLASMVAVSELRALFPFHHWRLLCVDASYEEVLTVTEPICRVMQPCNSTMDFNIAAAFWFASRGMGRLYQPTPEPPILPLPAPRPVTPPLRPSAEPFTAGDIQYHNLTPCSEDSYPMGQSAPAILFPSGESCDTVRFTISEEQAGAAAAATAVTALAKGKKPTVEIRFPEITVHNLVSRDGTQLGDGTPGAYCGEGNVPVGDVEGGQKRSKKFNKNMDELCPVNGCRRLLKPGCVFGSCSKCCLKVQQLVAAAAAGTPLVATSIADPSSSDTRVMPSVCTAKSAAREGNGPNAPKMGKTVIAGPDLADDVGDTSSRVSDARPGLQGEQERAKARAVVQHLRALEDHLTEHFVQLSPPFRVDHLCAVLRQKVLTRAARTGRDLHARVPTRQSTKLCVVHKRSTSSNSVAGDNVGHGNLGGEMDGHGHARLGGQGAQKREAAESVGSRSPGLGSLSTSWVPFTSEAKVLLVGIGADEFMGGYSRHRNAYNQGGIEALTSELVKDQGRLWTRNLGRDDRSIADHGREARFPFLDESVLAYIRSLPLRDVCDMDQPAGYGDKKILRQVAGYLGLDSCRALPKRAIQFGSRIAQHCARHTYGSHRRGSGSVPAVFGGPSGSLD